MKKRIIICFIISIFFISTGLSYSAAFEKRDTVEVGLKPNFGFALGEFMDTYPFPFGAAVYFRGLGQLNFGNSHSFYPEFRFNYNHIMHISESDRRINLYSFDFNFLWDWEKMHFKMDWGELRLNPYFGFKMACTTYDSDRKNVAGVDVGYQIGINLEIQPTIFKDLFVEFSFEQFIVGEISSAVMPGFSIYVGVGYSHNWFKTDEEKTADEKNQEQPQSSSSQQIIEKDKIQPPEN